jgi:hypothetical protein
MKEAYDPAKLKQPAPIKEKLALQGELLLLPPPIKDA